MKKITFFLFLILILGGCTHQEVKEGQVYVVKDDDYMEEQVGDILNIEGRIPFQKYVNQSFVDQMEIDQILLTIAPNGKELYFMERIETHDFTQVIKGNTGEQVRIIRKDITTKDQKIVIQNIPFVSKVSWNIEGDMVAFGGGGILTIYDRKNENTIMKEKLAQDNITNFFWSPIDASKLYSEQQDLANGSIYYLTSQKKVEAYETREETYYKGKLDSNYYYGTKWDLGNGDIKTVILDKQGKIIKALNSGRFRDAYEKSLVLVGDGGFGLFYIKDINNSQEVITLTEEYIYDVKFIADGNIAYTTKAEDIEANLFYLNIVNNSGRQLKKSKVYGGSIAVLPDGKTGYISGPQWQQVDFVEAKLITDSLGEEEELDEIKDIYKGIRGAMITLYDFRMEGKENWNNLKKYFINTDSPNQWAYFDMENIFKEKVDTSFTGYYAMDIYLKSYAMDSGGDRVSVKVSVNTKHSHARPMMLDYALELIKSQGAWYVTGFSTFPYSTEENKIEEIVKETVEKIQMGKLFSGKLENQNITIGQIQFWLRGLPRLASNVESADAVKVFLQVNNQEKQEVYKLVLEKVNQSYWKPINLSREDLSSL
ncbi:hypothetical protein [Natronincola ferrireducens]|uniref:hypothetical protein n=1 Tax=Natronincola ferrireducens TaxID=393762 RepID=UPI000B866A05|nr:hypothetical protein [Natronincola ferrireducens]